MDIYNSTSYQVYGTSGDDFVVNYVGFANVYGYGGNDTIAGAADGTWGEGGDGNDYFLNLAPGNYLSFFYGDAGNDILINDSSRGYFYGNEGNDTLANNSTNSNNVELDGGAGSDVVADFGFGMSTLTGGLWDGANDTLISGDGVNVFEFASYCGNDVIWGFKSYDVIFSYGSIADWSYQVVGTDALLTSAYGTSIYVQNGGAGVNFYTYEDSYASFDSLLGSYKSILGISDYSYDAASNKLWGDTNQYFGTAQADNIFVGKSDGNDLVFDTAADDTVHLYDATLSDIVSTSVTDSAIEISFDTGDITRVSSTGNVSPTFKLASGESFVYNREISSWQQV